MKRSRIMDEYPDILMWGVIVVAFIGGYLIVSFLASRMKTAQPFTRDNGDSNDCPETETNHGFVGKRDPVPSAGSASERLRALDQLKSDGLIDEQEYNAKRKKILGEL